MPRRAVRLITEAFQSHPGMDTAVARAVLKGVSDGAEPETLRLYRPGPVVSFGPQDAREPGFRDAVRAARAGGYEAVKRLSGGRAAVFHEQTIAFAWTTPDPAPRAGVQGRFEELAGIMVRAFTRLGIDARIGQVPGEYCPGSYSVNARGRVKLMGVAQRLARRAAHVGGVVVVDGAARIREVLLPVNEALRIEWRPEAVGALRDEAERATHEAVEDAILGEFSSLRELAPGRLSPDTVERARTMVAEYLEG